MEKRCACSALGYYDLSDPSIQTRQSKLAIDYGLGGFCFYFYWFGGKTLLEMPIKNYAENDEAALPFCLCWANENWSRRWDGLDSEILISQHHSPDDDLAFISHIAVYLKNPKYIKIDGKPLLIVYRPSLLPSAIETTTRWRAWCRANGIGEIYLAYTQSFETIDPAEYGFDGAIEFPPNNSSPPNITDMVPEKAADFSGTIYDWRVFLTRSLSYQQKQYRLFRSVCPSWDNTARRKKKSTIFVNSNPNLYQYWLENAIVETALNSIAEDDNIVFVNAWNEWAEGAYLEPDVTYGDAWLQATSNAVTLNKQELWRKIIVITHDCHPHGAQFLTLHMIKQMQVLGYRPVVIALGNGKLFNNFAEIAPVILASDYPDISQFLTGLWRLGYRSAMTSTTVSGSTLPLLKMHGFRVLALIHEMPKLIQEMNLESAAQSIAEMADHVVFPADLVRDGFIGMTQLPTGKTQIRHQGLVRKNPYAGKHEIAFQEICHNHNLNAQTKIVLAIGFMDHRKGGDLFAEIAAYVCSKNSDIVFIWVGHTDPGVEKAARAIAVKAGISDRLIFTGFLSEPMAYYAAASVYALTSREDPFPNVAIESASVNVPIVAFSSTTGAEDFLLAEGGRTAAQFNVEEFGDHITQLIEDQQHPKDTAGHISFQKSKFSMSGYILDLAASLNDQLRVSVIVPNYNYAHHIQQRLSSIKDQTFPIYECIILDDASTDNSVAVIRDFLSDEPFDNELIINEKNSGSVFSQWKKGIEQASGDLIWIAEADDYADPLFLAKLVDLFRDKDVVLAYSQSAQVDENGSKLAADYLYYTDLISDRWHSSYVADGLEEISQGLSIKNTIPNVSGVLFRRDKLLEALETCGDQLTNLSVAGDWLVYLNILRLGRIGFCNQSLNTHRRHSKSATKKTNLKKHLNEIVKMQLYADKLSPAGSELRAKAVDYIAFLKSQFNLK
jgi:O-antigen biosynthesis protein